LANDHSLAVTGGYDSRIILWDINTGTNIRSFYGHSEKITSLVLNTENINDMINMFLQDKEGK